MQSEHQTLPTAATIRAAISLLGDPDARVAEACRNQLVRWGAVVRPILSHALEAPDPRQRLRARALMRSLDLQEWVQDVRRFAARLTERRGRAAHELLQDGALLISSLSRPAAPGFVEARRLLEEYGRELRPRVHDKTAASSARLLADFLCGQLGFTGNRTSYFDVENALLDRVLERRKGIPVSLSLLYILVGRRAGLEMSGVSMPDHFLVRVHGARPVLIDPFHDGRTVTKADCIRYLRTAGYGFQASYMEDVGDRQILVDLLTNLQRIYGYREDREACVAVQQALGHLVDA